MKIILGTANYNTSYGVLKNKMKKKDLIEVLDVCKINKINKIDTASGYKNLSRILNKKKNNWEIFTKIKISKESYIKEFEKIHKNYSNYQINLLLHNTLDLKNKKFKKFILEIQQRKNIKIGISIYNVKEIFESYRKIKYSFIQAPGNLFDNRVILNKRVKNFLRKNKIKLFIRSIFLQGILCLDKNLIIKKLKDLKKPIELIQKEFGKEKKIIKKLTLQWISSNKIVDGYVIGVNNKKQLIENINLVNSFNENKTLHQKLLKLINTFKISEKVINPTKWSFK
tara:strand:+ start:918 stop:1766 length:849 start_codon:yes stop_codon:yes gene_type:complete